MDIEKGRKAAPRKELIERLIEIFKIKDQLEIDHVYDMAAKTKEKGLVPEDVKETFEEYEKFPALMRAIKRKNLKNETLDKIIRDIEKGKYGK